MPAHRPDAERFWEKVEKAAGCWLWTAYIFPHGYGGFRLYRPRQTTYAHRFSYELNVGPIPPGMDVCHHCDIRNCVRPDHLFLGTAFDNMRDAAAKGRIFRTAALMPEVMRRGDNHPNRKLNSDQVREIRARYAAGEMGCRRLARAYAVTPGNILYIVHGKSWKHVA